jgi:hypothetical protein
MVVYAMFLVPPLVVFVTCWLLFLVLWFDHILSAFWSKHLLRPVVSKLCSAFGVPTSVGLSWRLVKMSLLSWGYGALVIFIFAIYLYFTGPRSFS